MSREELIEALGTIARSGTKAFIDRLEAAKDDEETALIGRFGVGFYSAFMVADRVEVFSRRAGSDTAHVWSSDGKGSFAVAAAEAAYAPRRGTRVVLHLMEDAKSYTERATIERLVHAQSGHVPVPIAIVEKPGAEACRDHRRRGAVGQAEILDHARRLYRFLPQHCRPVRRAGAHHSFPRRGPARLHVVVLRARRAAVRSVRSRSQGPHQALRQARLHHRRCRDPAALSALRARPRRQRRSAAQRLAREDPGKPAPRRHPQRRHQPCALGIGAARRQGAGQLQEDLGTVRRRPQGGRVRGFRAPRCAARAGALQDHRRRRSVAKPERVCRRAQAQSDRDLLSRRRRHRAAEILAASRRLPRARHRGAAACPIRSIPSG